MTEPLTPVDCDLSGNDWFQFHFMRLRKSKWWRRASDLARARNVMLWGEAYASVPAGSLPDDDDELAEAAGFGFDVDAFIAAKVEIMAPWVLCSDGRWYHPTICEVALEAWHRLSDTRRKEAARKAEQRAKVRGHRSAVPPGSPDVPRDNPEKPRDFAHSTDRQDRTDINPPSPQGDEREEAEYFAKALQAYPAEGRANTKPRVAAEAFRVAAQKSPPQALLAATLAYAASPVVKLRPKSIPKFENWLSGGLYEHWLGESPTGHRGHAQWTGPPEVRDSVIGERGEAFVGSYLDPAGWQEVPVRAVICRNGLAAEKLKREVGHVFSDAGIEIHAAARVSA